MIAMMMGFGGFGLFVMLFFILVIGAAIALVSLLFPRPASPGNAHPRSPRPIQDDSALEILKQRYARGEITREEFDAMKQDILSA
jgi:putative membrane protein